MRRFLFACSNENQVKTFAPVAEGLKVAGHQVAFLSFDEHYHQRASEAASERGYQRFLLPSKGEIPNWWALSDAQQKPFLLAAYPEIEKIFADFSPQCLIVGNDYGPFEQVAIRTAEHRGIHTARLQDGLMSAKLFSPDKRQHAFLMGDNACELVCHWDHLHARTSYQRTRSGRHIASGNPRYDVLADWEGPPEPSPPYRVLLATQCFSKYNLLSEEDEFETYKKLIEQILKRDDTVVLLKLHPQVHNKTRYEKLAEDFADRVSLLHEEDSLSVLRSADALITLSSTVYIESSLMRIPTARLLYLNGRKNSDIQKEEHEFLSQLYSDEFPKSLCFGHKGVAYTSFQCSRPLDGKATERVVKALLELLADGQAGEGFQAPVSVLIETATASPLSAVRALLRDKNKNLQVLVVDRSADGNISKLLSSIADKRLLLLPAPKHTALQALRLGITHCTAPFILRLDPNCITYPRWAEQLLRALKSAPRAKVVMSWHSYRSDSGHAAQIRSLPAHPRLESLIEDPHFSTSLKAYGFRKEAFYAAGGIRTADENADAALFRSLVQTSEDCAVVPASLFFTPFVPPFLELEQTKPILPVEWPHEPEISVILCSYNRAEKVKKCLAAFSSQTISRDRFEIICVDDGSTDGTAQAMREGLKPYNGHFIAHGNNRALAAARNTGIKNAWGKYIVLINDDTYVTPEFLEEHLATHKQHADRKIAVHGYLPFIKDFDGKLFSHALMKHDLYFGYHRLREDLPYTFWHFIGGNLSLPRAAFVENNTWFDESFRCYGYEDIECGYRLFLQGYRVFYNPRAVAIHDHHITIENYIKRESHNAVNILEFVRKHPDPYVSLNLLGVPRLTEEVLSEWEELVEQRKDAIDRMTAEITSVEDQAITPENVDDSADFVKAIADGTKLISEWVKLKSFLEELENNPGLRHYLLSPSWNGACEERRALWQSAGISV